MNDRRRPDDEAATAPPDEPEFHVTDRRHWAAGAEDGDEGGTAGESAPARPSVLDEYRLRAEAAEKKLREYIEAYKKDLDEQEQFRLRLSRDVDRRAELRFGNLVTELLDAADELDLALNHARDVPAAQALARGVQLTRDRFVAALERAGIARVVPAGAAFDPNEAEAVRVDPVDSPEQDRMVTEVLQPGYRLGERVLRPAKVAVGRRHA